MAQPTVEARVLQGHAVFLACKVVQSIARERRSWRRRDFSWPRGCSAFPASSLRVNAVFPPSSAAGTDTRDTSVGVLPFSAPPFARIDLAPLPFHFSTFQKSFGKRPLAHVELPQVEGGEACVSFPSGRGSMHWEA